MLQLNIVKPYKNMSEIFQNHLSISHLHTTITYHIYKLNTKDHWALERTMLYSEYRPKVGWKRKATKLKMNLLKQSETIKWTNTSLFSTSYTKKRACKALISVRLHDNTFFYIFLTISIWMFDHSIRIMVCFAFV